MHLPERSEGQTLIEYGIILALVAFISVLALGVMGVSVRDAYCAVAGPFTGYRGPCATDYLFQDGFDDISAWDFLTGGTWTNEDGQLCTDRGGEHRALAGDESWDDYTVNLDSAEMSGGNGYGVYFRATGESNIDSYVFQYDPGYRGGSYPNGSFLFRKVTDGRESAPLAVAAAPSDYQWNDVNHQVSVEVEGDTFTALVDGEEVVQASDSEYTNGRAGLRTWDSTVVCFDDFNVVGQ